MKAKNIILRTPTYDYFRTPDEPFNVIHNHRQSTVQTTKETLKESSGNKSKKTVKEKSYKEKIYFNQDLMCSFNQL